MHAPQTPKIGMIYLDRWMSHNAPKMSASTALLTMLMPLPALAQPTPSAAAVCTPGWPAPPAWFIYLVIIAVFAALFFALAAVRQHLGRASGWSLADALSEESDLTVLDASGQVQLQGNTPLKKTVLVASSSRLIALVGMLAILALFIGFGVFILWGFAETGCVPSSASEALKFMLGGMTFFAPYAVNKVAGAVSGN